MIEQPQLKAFPEGSAGLPSFPALVNSSIAYLVIIAMFGVYLEIFLTPLSAWQSLDGLAEILTTVAVITIEYLLCACLIGLVWGGLTFLLQRAARSDKPLSQMLDASSGTGNRHSRAVLRLSLLAGALSAAALLAFSVFEINLFFLRADFRNLPLAALVSMLCIIAALLVALLCALPVFIVARAFFSLPFGKTISEHKLYNSPHLLQIIEALLLLAILLLLYLNWEIVERVQFYDSYLLAGALAAITIAFLPFKDRFISQHSRLFKKLTFIWPVFVVVGFCLLLVLTESPACRYVAFEKTTLAGHFLKDIRKVIDLDMDGYPTFMGGGDCAPFDKSVYPDSVEIPGNHKDDNCVGGDRKFGNYRNTEHPFDVPEKFLAGDYRLIIISIDAARIRNMSLYGYKRETTENLSEWAEKRNAFIFENAYCHIPATRWSIPLIFSSQYPSDIQWDTSGFPYNVGKSTFMLPEVLNNHGFYTSAFWTAHKKHWGLDQGFDRFTTQDPKKDAVSGRRVTEYAVDFLNHNNDVRYFLWLHYYEPHDPYISHSEADFGRKDIDNYDEEIWSADREIGKVFAEMDKLGAWDDTIVLVISDHGEAFMEHGQRHHSYQTYDEMINVPMVWWIPGRKGGRIGTPVGLLDVMPTVLNLFGYSDGWEKLRGQSMAALFFGDEEAYTPRPQFISTSWSPSYPKGSVKAVVDEDWKLIYNVPSQVYELYDLKNDPLEQHNIYNPDHEAVTRLLPLLYHEMDEIRQNRTVYVRKK